MKRILIYSLIVLAGIFQACKEEMVGQPATDSTAPGQLTDVQIENIAGGAIFTYKLPIDEDLLYIEAQYERNGKTTDMKASCFESSLKLEGYADTEEHEVKLYAVDRSMNYSAPVVVKIKPEENPVTAISKTLTMTGDIGGVHVTWENTTRTPINLMVYAADATGAMQLADVVYTSIAEGDYYLRGYDDQKRRFGVLVKDRWDNYSDTIADYFIPRFEQAIDGKGIKKIQLTEDNNTTLGGNYYFSNMFDGVHVGDASFWHTKDAQTDPEHGCYFTIDLGHLVKLTRYKLYQRGGSWYYTHHNPKVWEVYARAEDPKLIYQTHYENDIDYWAQGFREDSENWYHLMHCVPIKPSGFDNPVVTAEDSEYAVNGHEFIISEDAPAVRYIRFTIDQSWGGGIHPTLCHISELEFYGKIVDEE